MTHKNSFHVMSSGQHKPIISSKNAEVQLQKMQLPELCYLASAHCSDCHSANLKSQRK